MRKFDVRIRSVGSALLASAAWFAVEFTLVAVTAPGTAQATVVIALSREDLTDRSDLVVQAQVLARESHWNADRSQIVTITRLRVAQYVKGSGPQELLLRQFGGEVDGLVSRVAGDGVLQVGEQAILFLRRGEGVVFLTALAQSVYHIVETPDHGAVARRDLHGLTFANLSSGVSQLREPDAEPDISVGALIRAVTARVRR